MELLSRWRGRGTGALPGPRRKGRSLARAVWALGVGCLLSGCLSQGRVRFGMAINPHYSDEGDGPPAAMRLLLHLPGVRAKLSPADLQEELRVLRGRYAADRFGAARLERSRWVVDHRRAKLERRRAEERVRRLSRALEEHPCPEVRQDLGQAQCWLDHAAAVEKECGESRRLNEERCAVGEACAQRIHGVELQLERLRRSPGVASRLHDMDRICTSMAIELERAARRQELTPFGSEGDLDWCDLERRVELLEDTLARFRSHLDRALVHLAKGEHVDAGFALADAGLVEREFRDEVVHVREEGSQAVARRDGAARARTGTATDASASDPFAPQTGQ